MSTKTVVIVLIVATVLIGASLLAYELHTEPDTKVAEGLTLISREVEGDSIVEHYSGETTISGMYHYSPEGFYLFDGILFTVDRKFEHTMPFDAGPLTFNKWEEILPTFGLSSSGSESVSGCQELTGTATIRIGNVMREDSPIGAIIVSVDVKEVLHIDAPIVAHKNFDPRCNEASDEEPRACTMDAKLCPDGSYVGRTGPKCEFAPCPGGDDIVPSNSGIRGTVFLGPVCPVMTDPPDPDCADKKYEARLALTTPDGARVISEFSSNADGRFSVNAAPGDYAIRSAAAANVLPYCSSNDTIRVFASLYTETIVSCDTGIR